jgi:hypothetical protein
MSQSTSPRTEHFRANCLAWAALCHFLPAHLVRELSYILVETVSRGQLEFRQLFAEDMTVGSDGLESWVVRPRAVTDRLAQYMQQRIQYFIWSNDREVFYDKDLQHSADTVNPRSLEDAVRLGQADLSMLDQLAPQLDFSAQESIGKLASAIKLTRQLYHAPDPPVNVEGIIDLCSSIQSPLDAVALKHLGDLSADDDQWVGALNLYRASYNKLEGETPEAWKEYIDILESIITQSIAAALRTVRGNAAAADYLAPKVETTSLIKHPVFLLNASHDAHIAELYATDTFQFKPDRRASILSDPLLLKSKDLSAAFESWKDGDYQDAHRQFWSILRRQIALGSAVEMRMTQAYYGKSVLDALDAKAERELNKSLFSMGLRLLLQSGRSNLAGKIRWNETFVQTYVDDDALNLVLAQANTLDASKDERIAVAIELIHGWGGVLSIEQAALAERMLRFVIEAGISYKTSLVTHLNIGGRSVEVLRDLAEKRPEFRAGVAAEIAPLILSKFGRGVFWTATAEALKLAHLYFGVMAAEDIRTIIIATLSQLDDIDPSRGMWPVVQPALDLLVSGAVQAISKADQELGHRIVSTMLRFGLNQKTEHTRLLYYLYHFDLASIYEEPTSSQLREVVIDVRKQALTINASNSINNICALLLASSVAGRDGIKDALEAMRQTLLSALGVQRTVSLSFPFAYDAFIILAQRQEEVANDISLSTDQFREWLRPLLDLIIEVWSKAKSTPLIFAQFSFPLPTKADPIIIHNWAFGSIAFAKSLGQFERIQAALDSAAEEPTLKDPIASARAVRLASGERGTFDSVVIRSESAVTFYSALGQRLVFLQSVHPEERESILDALLDQCLRFGPNGLDAAVFLAAGNSKIGTRRGSSTYDNYFKRVGNNRTLRLALMPFLADECSN